MIEPSPATAGATPRTPGRFSAVGCLCVAIGLVIASLALWLAIMNLRPPADTRTVVGVITRTDGPAGARRPVVDYVVDGTTYQAWGPHGSACRGGGCIGASATVRYHVANPSQAEVLPLGEGGTIFLQLMLTGLGLGITWLGAWVVVGEGLVGAAEGGQHLLGMAKIEQVDGGGVAAFEGGDL